MSDDLVKRLRDQTILERFENGYVSQIRNPDGPEAASRIEKLEAALREIAESAWDCTGDTCDHCKPDNCSNRDIARKALEGKDD